MSKAIELTLQELLSGFEAKLEPRLGEMGYLKDVSAKLQSRVEFLESMLKQQTRGAYVPGLDDEIKKTGFNLARAIAAAYTGNWKSAEKEKEMCEASAKALAANSPQMHQWILGQVAGDDSRGGVFIPTVVSDRIIELLVAQAIALALGAESMTGLSGNVLMPKETSGWTISLQGEGQAVQPSTANTGEVVLRPRTVIGMAKYSLQLLRNASTSISGWVERGLARDLATAIDSFVFNGIGTLQGLITHPGVQTYVNAAGNPGEIDLPDLHAMEELLNDVNAPAQGRAWWGHNRVFGRIRALADSTGRPLWQTDIALGLRPSLLSYPFGWRSDMATTGTQGAGTLAGPLGLSYMPDILLAFWDMLRIEASEAPGFSELTVHTRAYVGFDTASLRPQTTVVNRSSLITQ